MKKNVLVTLLCTLSLLATAQESKYAVSFTPALVQTPTLRFGFQPGFEYHFNDRLSLLTELCYAIGNNKDLTVSNSHYFRVKPELRYLLPVRRRGQHYIGLQLSYAIRNWDDANGGCFFDKESYPDSSINYRKAHITSPIFTSTIQFGKLIPLGDHFNLDAFVGMGARVVFTNYSRLENISYNKERLWRTCIRIPAPDPAYWVNGTLARFQLNAGLRLLYRF
jgi:hypothetical protein